MTTNPIGTIVFIALEPPTHSFVFTVQFWIFALSSLISESMNSAIKLNIISSARLSRCNEVQKGEAFAVAGATVSGRGA